MTQFNPIIGSGKSGIAYRGDDNDGKQALLSHHKGSSAPSYAEAGVLWLDDSGTPWKMKVYDGADWIVLAEINASNNTANPYQGTTALRLLNNASDSGAANAYAVAPAPATAAYAAGQIVVLKPANANTGASTIAVNGLTAKNIKMPSGGDPPAGALLASGVYILVYDGTNFVLTNPSTSAFSYRGAVAYNSANQAIPTATYTAITFDTESIDTDGVHSTSSNTSRLTVPSGVTKVRLVGQYGFRNTGLNTLREIKFYKNGSFIVADGTTPSPRAGLYTSVGTASDSYFGLMSPALSCTAGDYFELFVRQDSGSTIDAYAGQTWFEMQILG